MAQLLLLLVVALVVAGIGFGVVVLITGGDPGLAPAEPDGRAVPLPGGRPLAEADIEALRFDTALRGYRMSQVDGALRRAAYDIGYKEELITVLMAEVDALRAGRADDAELLRQARDQAIAAARPAPVAPLAVVVPEPVDAVPDAAASPRGLDAEDAEDAEATAAPTAAACATASVAAGAAGSAERAGAERSELEDDPPDWSVEVADAKSTTGRR